MALTKVSNDLLATPPTDYDDSGIQTDIALLGFKVAANGSLAAYNLKDQTIDAFEDASGIDASASTDETRNASNYYSGGVVGSYSITALTSSGSWTVPANTSEAEILVVGGGGAGRGGDRPYIGGGGAGGIVHHSSYSLAASGTTYNITVGAGGIGTDYPSTARPGSDSVFDSSGTTLTMTANGGGAGGYQVASYGAATSGGSGGGGGSGQPGASSNQGAVTGATVYGNAGDSGSGGYGGGGGGAGETGGTDGGGEGGDGAYFANFDSYGTDTSNSKGSGDGSGSGKGYFGGGGGGSTETGTSLTGGGIGGGGRARHSGDGIGAGFAAQANTGGGGGGARSFDQNGQRSGGSGGSGIVLIRHRPLSYNDMTLVSNATTADSTPTTGDIVMTYTNGAGTATVNTDIKAWISRDNGTTWTQATLSSEGTTGGHTILTAHNVDISSQPSGTSMRYKIETLNQSASKETRIQAVSLGWA